MKRICLFLAGLLIAYSAVLCNSFITDALRVYEKRISNNKKVSIHSHYLFADDSVRKDGKKNEDAPQKINNSDTTTVLITVMIAILVIWIGISVFLFRIDRRISKLEKKINE